MLLNFCFLLFALSLPLGERIIGSELETEELRVRGARIWRVLWGAGACAGLLMRAAGLPSWRVDALFGIFLYCALLGIADGLTGTVSVRLLGLSLLFIPAGCLMRGVKDALGGLAAMTCVSALMLLTKRLSGGRAEYGPADAVFAAAFSALAGLTGFVPWLSLICCAMLATGAGGLPAGKKGPLPLLPAYGAAAVLYAARLLLKE